MEKKLKELQGVRRHLHLQGEGVVGKKLKELQGGRGHLHVEGVLGVGGRNCCRGGRGVGGEVAAVNRCVGSCQHCNQHNCWD